MSILIVWALYPESNQRTLEEMDLVFASDKIWNWEAEKTFARLKAEHPELTQAEKSVSDSVEAEKGALQPLGDVSTLEDGHSFGSLKVPKPKAGACEETCVEHV